MQIIKPDTNVDFVGKSRIAIILSLLIILAGMVCLWGKGGFKYGIDFAGGILIQVQFSQPTEAVEIRDALRGLPLGSFTVQEFGSATNEFLIRAQDTQGEAQAISDSVRSALEARYGEGSLEIRRTEMVGSQVGNDLKKKGAMGLFYAMIATLVYIAWRFELRFAVGAVVALLHDVLITLAFFSFFNKEIDLTSMAAFLTIIGYSLNDTIVIYDRIRENRKKFSRNDFSSVINISLNETLSRTILTSGTTLLVVIPLFIFGGTVINTFAFAMLVGIVAGTYSSIFIASALVLYWEKMHPKNNTESVSG